MWSKTPDILARNTGQGSWEGYSWRDHLNSTAVNYHATRGFFFTHVQCLVLFPYYTNSCSDHILACLIWYAVRLTQFAFHILLQRFCKSLYLCYDTAQARPQRWSSSV